MTATKPTATKPTATERPRLLAIAADWGRADAERRHRAGLLSALNDAGLAAELLVLGDDPFDSRALGNWAGVTGQVARLDDPGSLIAQTAAVRAVLARGSAAFAWGLDAAGNQASRVAQALDRSISRLVTAQPTPPGGGGLRGRLSALLARDPNLTVGRTGAPAVRDAIDLPPGVDARQLRRHSPDSLARIALRQARVDPARALFAALCETGAGRERVRALDGALRAAGEAPLWLWLGVGPAPDGLDALDGAGVEVGGALPLFSVCRAAVLPDGGGLSRLVAREAATLGRPAFVAADSRDLDAAVGVVALPDDTGEAARGLASITDDPGRAAAARRRAETDWSVTAEARRLADTVLRRAG